MTTTFFADADGDGYGRADKSLESCASAVSGYVEQDGDCDDGDASVSPAGTESCDGVDNNCDGDTDEDGAVGSFTVYIDADADGYGGLDSREVCAAPSGTTSTSTDCDDDEASVSPGASERCNTIDDDCDGDTDEAGALGEVLWYLDADNDGEGGIMALTALVQRSLKQGSRLSYVVGILGIFGASLFFGARFDRKNSAPSGMNAGK